jgi:hypothetical protein
MNGASPVLVISVMLTAFCVLALVPVIMAVRSSDEAKRLMEVTRSPLRLEAKAEPGNRASRVLLGVVHFVRTRLGLEQDERLRQKPGCARRRRLTRTSRFA